ncbi:unnamed protein product [Urochloa humidicola]
MSVCAAPSSSLRPCALLLDPFTRSDSALLVSHPREAARLLASICCRHLQCSSLALWVSTEKGQAAARCQIHNQVQV